MSSRQHHTYLGADHIEIILHFLCASRLFLHLAKIRKTSKVLERFQINPNPPASQPWLVPSAFVASCYSKPPQLHGVGSDARRLEAKKEARRTNIPAQQSKANTATATPSGEEKELSLHDFKQEMHWICIYIYVYCIQISDLSMPRLLPERTFPEGSPDKDKSDA